jgi:hypothetical protein
MNNYLDLTDIDTRLNLVLDLEPIGTPMISVSIGNTLCYNSASSDPIIITTVLPLLDTFDIIISLSDKHYTTEYETAIIIKKLSIDNINIIPEYNHLVDYQNDHNNNSPTNYLGFNGEWTLKINRPFYQWLHQAQGHGWLLT